MPSDELKRRALEALRPRIETFRSAVAEAVDEVRAVLDAQRSPRGGATGRAAAELGAFALDRIDTERFAALFADGDSLDPAAVERMEAALETMVAVLEAGDDAHVCHVEPGADLRDAVRAALGSAGRAFGAARAVEVVRAGREPGTGFAAGFPPERWNRAEWQVAPPLVVDLQGADLRPSGLAEYLDGGAAIVLVVRRPAPPAALARLVAPGILVVQAREADGLGALDGWEGPAVVALIPEGAAEFVFRPADAGTSTIGRIPEGKPRTLGSLTAARQEADLALLRLLADAAAGRMAAAVGDAAGDREGVTEPLDPAGRLAAWLLRQADVPAPGAA